MRHFTVGEKFKLIFEGLSHGEDMRDTTAEVEILSFDIDEPTLEVDDKEVEFLLGVASYRILSVDDPRDIRMVGHVGTMVSIAGADWRHTFWPVEVIFA